MERKKAQILLITLLVLTIIAIVTVSLVTLVNRDIQQVASTEQYEEAYNTSENQLKRVLDVYSNPSVPISQLLTTFNNPNQISCIEEDPQRKLYSCTVTSNEFSTANLQTEIQVQDTKDVNDFQIFKDRTFDMNLGGTFSGELQFWWDKNAAIEFELIYTDPSGVIQSVRDIYENGSPRIFTGLATDNPYNDIDSIHPFNFQDVPTMPDATSVRFTISQILNLQGTPVSGSFLTLKITPRMTDQFSSVLLNARASSTAIPDQIREFKSTSVNQSAGASTPVAVIETKIPLAPQPDNFLDSAITTEGVLRNTP